MKKYLLLFLVSISSSGYAHDFSDYDRESEKVYISYPFQVNLIDEMAFITTKDNILVLQRISSDDQGVYYLGEDLVSIIRRNMDDLDSTFKDGK